MAKAKKTTSDVQPKEVKRNSKGLICNWDGTSSDAEFLKILVQSGSLEGMTQAQIQKEKRHAAFAECANATFASALSNMKKALGKEVETQRAGGSDGEKFSSLSVPFVADRGSWTGSHARSSSPFAFFQL